jgi:hypothetical protein
MASCFFLRRYSMMGEHNLAMAEAIDGFVATIRAECITNECAGCADERRGEGVVMMSVCGGSCRQRD